MQKDSPVTDTLGRTLATLLLRLWLGMRALQAGIEKYAGIDSISEATMVDGEANEYGLESTSAVKAYALDNYSGVPTSLMEKFKDEPLIPSWGLGVYDTILGPLLITLGIMLLLGICTRLTLFTMGLLYTSLTFGLILINQPSGIAWLGTHVILIVLMLLNAQYNRFEVGSRVAFLRNK